MAKGGKRTVPATIANGNIRKQRRMQSARPSGINVSFNEDVQNVVGPGKKTSATNPARLKQNRTLKSNLQSRELSSDDDQAMPTPVSIRVDSRVSRQVTPEPELSPSHSRDSAQRAAHLSGVLDKASVKDIIEDAEARIISHMNMLNARLSTRLGGCESHIGTLTKSSDKLGTEYFASYMEDCHDKQDDARMSKRALSVVMYGLSTHQTKSEFKTGLGKKHADFRFRVAKCCSNHSRLLSDDAFRHHEQLFAAGISSRKQSSVDTANDIANSICKPAWLAPGFISKDIMDMSRKFHECVKLEMPKVPEHPDKKLALHIGKTVVNTVHDMLRRSRYTSKRKVFEAGLFLLGEWKAFKSFKPSIHSQSRVRFIWQNIPPIAPSEVQLCFAATEEISEKNCGLLKELIASRKEMIIEAEYHVAVTPRSAAERRRLEATADVRPLLRHMNILHMALCFVQAYCFNPQDDILNVHPSLLRTIYRIAVVFREWFIDYVEEDERTPRAFEEIPNISSEMPRYVFGTLEQLPSREETENGKPIQLMESNASANQPNHSTKKKTAAESAPPPITSIMLEHFFPSPSEMETHMMRVLTVSTDVYDRLNARAYIDDDGTDENVGSNALDAVAPEDSDSDEDMGGMVDEL